MTSDDTHSQTLALLQRQNWYGQNNRVPNKWHVDIRLLKQQKVPSIADNQGRFVLCENQQLKVQQIQTKPHGHGDIHTLLHQHGIVAQWHQKGLKHVVFFQDTNPLALRAFPALIGVSIKNDYDFCSIAVPRRPGDAVGAIATLRDNKDPNISITVNIEYNYLKTLFSGNQKEPTDSEGFSMFPGNINCFAIKLATYVDTLKRTSGQVSQFVNPKYTDDSKTKFKSPTRLQCLMQDYPLLLPTAGSRVGFVNFSRQYCYSPLKNDFQTGRTKMLANSAGQCAASCQQEFYAANRALLRAAGAIVHQWTPVDVAGMKLKLFPMVVIRPEFATCLKVLSGEGNWLQIERGDYIEIYHIY